MEKHSADITRNELTYAVKQLYYSMLLADDMVKIATESYENALKNKAAIKGRFSGGRISNVNNIKMEADISGRVPNMLQAQQSYDLVEVSMRDVLGLTDGKEIFLAVIDNIENNDHEHKISCSYEKQVLSSQRFCKTCDAASCYPPKDPACSYKSI